MTDLTRLHELLLVSGRLDLRAVARAAAELFEADGSVLFVVEEGVLGVGGAWPPAADVERRLHIPVGYGVVGLIANNGTSATLVDDAPRNPVHRELLRLGDGDVVARLCVPTRGLDGAITGVMSVYRFGHRPFGEEDLSRAQRMGDLIGLRQCAEGLQGAAEEHHAQRNQLIAQAISAQEAERRRIAGDLHDGVTQALASLAFHLSAAHSGLSALSAAGATDPRITGTLEEIAAAKQLAGLAYDETRAAITGLHSLLLEDLGLEAALESLCQSVPQLDAEFRSEEDERFDDIPDHAAAALYRIAQEGLNNAVKHAEASHAVVSMRRVGDAVVLGVTDDGIGFDVASVRDHDPGEGVEHFGLDSIVERAALIGANLRIDSVEGRGTAIFVELSLPHRSV